jgi:hypothetical protein
MRADRYDKIRETMTEERANELSIFRIHPSFRVLALALPPDPRSFLKFQALLTPTTRP